MEKKLLPVWSVSGQLVYNESGEVYNYYETIVAADRFEATKHLYLHELRGYSVVSGTVKAMKLSFKEDN